MNIAQFLLQELQLENKSTSNTLKRVDFAKADWKPHSKSMGFVQLAKHIADLCDWPARIINSDVLDFQTEDLSSPDIDSAATLVAYAENNMQKTMAALEKWEESDFQTIWTLKSGDHVIMQMPKALAIRYICQNHILHHRAQLTTYLRQLDIPVPALYGPSADEHS